MFSLAALPSERKPMTRRDKLREELDGLEKLARDRKLPYVDYLCNLRKQNGDDVLYAMIVKHCAPARKIGELRDYVGLQMNQQANLAIQAGYIELRSFKYSNSDVDAIASFVGRVLDIAEA